MAIVQTRKKNLEDFEGNNSFCKFSKVLSNTALKNSLKRCFVALFSYCWMPVAVS